MALGYIWITKTRLEVLMKEINEGKLPRLTHVESVAVCESHFTCFRLGEFSLIKIFELSSTKCCATKTYFFVELINSPWTQTLGFLNSLRQWWITIRTRDVHSRQSWAYHLVLSLACIQQASTFLLLSPGVTHEMTLVSAIISTNYAHWSSAIHWCKHINEIILVCSENPSRNCWVFQDYNAF